MKRHFETLFVALVVPTLLVVAGCMRPPEEAQEAPPVRNAAGKDDIATLRKELQAVASDMAQLKQGMADLVDSLDVIEDLVKLTRRQCGANGDAIAGLRDHISLTMQQGDGGEELSAEDLAALVEKLAKMGVKLDPDARTIAMDGIVATPTGPLEFAVVAEGGKAHESLFLVRAEPRALNAALLALGLRPGQPGRFTGGKPVLPTGPAVEVSASWADKGATVDHRVEELVISLNAQAPIPQKGFVYHGSRHQRNSATGKRFYAADVTRDLIAVWNSPNAILDLSHPEAPFDDSFVANNEKMPPKGTPVTVTIRVPEAAKPKAEGDGER